MKIRAIIIEDEEPARMLVKNFLAAFSDIEIVGEYEDGFSGLKAMNENKPDLAFLDIQMPKLTGFEILELSEYKPVVIFTTAYDQFAIKAFEANAVDYLLKPFSRERFTKAVEKALDLIHNNSGNRNEVISILKHIDDTPEIIDRIAIRTGSKIHVVNTKDIIFLEADDDYVRIHTNGGEYLKEKTMKYFENHLDGNIFIRIHRSYMANVNFIQRLDYYDKESYSAVMKNNTILKVSNSGYKLLKAALKL